jgi:NitT/TauT family transport system substrate-binding protein
LIKIKDQYPDDVLALRRFPPKRPQSRSAEMNAPKTVFAALFALALGGHAGFADEAHSLSVRLDWLTTGYQAPFFLAAEKGWFKKAGLDVTIQQGTGSVTTVQLVGAGQFDVGFAALSTMAFARSKGFSVVSIAGFFRKGDLALLVPVDSPIRSPADTKGKKFVTTPGSLEAPFLDSFFAAGKLRRDDVELLNVDASAKISTYLSGTNDGVFSSTVYTLALVKEKRPSRPVLFADFGLNLPGFGLVVTQGNLKQKGEALRAFASVLAGSWAYVLAGHEEEAVQATLKAREQDRLNPDYLRGQLKNSLPFLYTEATVKQPIGVQSESDWAAAISLLEAAKVITPGSSAKDYFTNDYLDLNLVQSFGAGG